MIIITKLVVRNKLTLIKNDFCIKENGEISRENDSTCVSDESSLIKLVTNFKSVDTGALLFKYSTKENIAHRGFLTREKKLVDDLLKQ